MNSMYCVVLILFTVFFGRGGSPGTTQIIGMAASVRALLVSAADCPPGFPMMAALSLLSLSISRCPSHHQPSPLCHWLPGPLRLGARPGLLQNIHATASQVLSPGGSLFPLGICLIIIIICVCVCVCACVCCCHLPASLPLAFTHHTLLVWLVPCFVPKCSLL